MALFLDNCLSTIAAFIRFKSKKNKCENEYEHINMNVVGTISLVMFGECH